MQEPGDATPPDSRPLAIVAGDGALVAPASRELEAVGFGVARATGRATEARLVQLLGDPGAEVAVVASREDAIALRLALLVADRRPDLHLVVTIFDRAVAAQLLATDLRCTIVRSAEILAAAIAGPCADADVGVLRRGAGDRLEDLTYRGRLLRRPHRRPGPERLRHGVDRLTGALHPYDTSARILVAGVLGLIAMLVIDVVVAMADLGEGFLEAVLLATRTLTTVDGNDHLLDASAFTRVVSILTMLGTLASIALFSAGLVSRIVEPRHVGIIGRRALPRRDHVVIVGMGQIGLRTALLLRDAGIPIVGVDHSPAAVGVRLGRRYGFPIVLAEGADREVLRRVATGRARAVAAVTSDDLMNVEIALAARALADVPVVLRAGDGDVARETRSLLHLGIVRDAHRLVAVALASAALGHPAGLVLPDADGGLWIVDDAGGVAAWPPPAAPTGVAER